MDPKGKVCLVTGGARGLGKEVAKQLLQRGAKVGILDILQECGEKTVEEFQSRFGEENVSFIHCDITNKENLEVAFKNVLSVYGCLDILFNIAGIAMPPECVIRTNLQGSIDVMELAISHMHTDMGGKGGIIVCTSAIAGFYAVACAPEFHASSAGIIAYTRSRALECGKNCGINFRIIAPTIMNTEMLREFDEPRSVPASKSDANCPGEELEPIEVDQVARTALMVIEKTDLPQGASVKIVKNGSFLMYPEKMPFEKFLDS